jgi:asparagine synthase (glutamine-hydrolysing)
MALADLVHGLRAVLPHDLPPRLTPLEIACGRALDFDDRGHALRGGDREPFAALQLAVLPALRRPPCLVSFSGGVDSSLVLAAAAVAARRHRLALPIPVTLRYPEVPEAEEGAWQDLVVRHLGLGDWPRLTIADELDLVGPVAARHLRHHGVLWPPNLHSLVPVIERAGGGSILTGYGGDHILTHWPSRPLADVLAGRARPARRDPLRLLLAGAPRPIRYGWCRRQERPSPWLTERAQRASDDALAQIRARAPWSWPAWLDWRLRRRGLVLARAHFALLARAGGAHIDHPLLHPGFVGALARHGGRLGMGDRARLASAIAGDALPPAVTARQSKATFDGAFWSEHSRRFIEAWDGRGVDPDLVRVDLLDLRWRSSPAGAGTAMLLQEAWLSAQGNGKEK